MERDKTLNCAGLFLPNKEQFNGGDSYDTQERRRSDVQHMRVSRGTTTTTMVARQDQRPNGNSDDDDGVYGGH